MRKFIALAVIAAMGIAAAPIQEKQEGKLPNKGRDMMLSMGAGMKGNKLEKAIAKAAESPLGSKANPVRENMPEGEVAYLRKLRCEDGTAPKFDRAGNVGEGPYGFIVDLYKVTCPGKDAVDVHIDMYHDGGETRPVPGFTIVN
ncbi:hypothetical protein [Sphingomonas sp. NIBR02145]|uniref:hypothetical protein n=1 Tax=Sphingomonas sp. NIBR02145 TaxID=3014784 RepID=UPI0022B2FE26|nr:hypothetical protein [Sphingomonas sp. NIBR02145]WHU01142.1 hypothetical protein O3305_13070 [Sphingomonas sp. NIBR02145]